MARTENRLTAKQVEKAEDGVHADGGNLILRVKNGGRSKSWKLRYTRDGKVVEIGLGGANRVTLKLARKLRDEHMANLADGRDPREEKRKLAAARRNRKTFSQAAKEVIAARRGGWRTNAINGRTSSLDDWTKNLLLVDCKPIADRYVEEIDSDDVERIVRPHWDAGHHHTARRVLKRVSKVFAYAKSKNWRKSDNPAAWDIFEHRLQARAPTGPKSHHPSLDWRQTPDFMARLRASEPSMAALALELMVLTASRSGEVRGMKWTELSDDMATWTVSKERMKRGVEHEVPLSDDAVALLKKLEPARINQFVFPGRSNARPIAHWSIWELVQRLTGRKEDEPSTASPHGMRSAFRSWAADQSVPHDVAEACLAHSVGNATSQAYNRETLLRHRRDVMRMWAKFLSGEDAANVVPLRRA